MVPGGRRRRGPRCLQRDRSRVFFRRNPVPAHGIHGYPGTTFIDSIRLLKCKWITLSFLVNCRLRIPVRNCVAIETIAKRSKRRGNRITETNLETMNWREQEKMNNRPIIPPSSLSLPDHRTVLTTHAAKLGQQHCAVTADCQRKFSYARVRRRTRR